MTAASNKLRVICFGIPPDFLGPIKKILNNHDVVTLPLDRESIFSANQKPIPAIILCGSPKDFCSLEAAQLLRSQFINSKIYHFETQKAEYSRKDLINNGFNEVFLIPIDWEFVKKTIQDEVTVHSADSLNYRPIRLIDIRPGSILNFDTSLYFKTNKKYVKLSVAGDPLDQERIDQLFSKKHQYVFVTSDQLPAFYDYTTDRLRDLGSTPDGQQQRVEAVRNLISSIFDKSKADITNGNKLTQDCREIVKRYIDQTEGIGWYDQLIRTMTGKSSVHSHGCNVSAYAAIFSMGTGIGNPEELGIAGLLHDIGISELPSSLQLKSVGAMSPQELTMYQTHPELTIKMLKEQKLQLPENVYKIILEHHEKFNGEGYPRKLKGDQISPEAQLLSIADRLDYLTMVIDEKMKMAPMEAAEIFFQEMARDDTRQDIDPKIMLKVMNLIFKKENKNS